MISCILLTAGLSERFGSPKALVQIQGHTVIEHLQEMLLKTPVTETIAVLGADSQAIKPLLLKHISIKSVYNKNYNLGQTSSFKVGLHALSPKAQAVLLLPIDYPLIQASTIATLCEEFAKDPHRILIPTFGGRKGHPPLFPIRLREEFLSLRNDQGLNILAHQHGDGTTLVPVKDRGVMASFNTVEEFKALRARG